MITERLPAMTEAGMSTVVLDPQGRLLSLCVVPPTREAAADSPRPVAWEPLLRAAGLVPSRLRSVAPEHVPPVFCEQRAAWEGVLAHAPDYPVRIEAASHRGKPVWFQLMHEPDAQRWSLERTHLFARDTADMVQGVVLLAVLVAAVLMARRNLQLRRGDRKGAVRLAAFVACAYLAIWVLHAHHVPVLRAQFEQATIAIGRALFVAAAAWILYIALEPHLRRRWPDMLIAWSRLLAGRWGDPLIGRDIIIGGLFGIFAMILTAARTFGPGWLGLPPPQPASVPVITFLGLRYELTQLIQIVLNALVQPMAL